MLGNFERDEKNYPFGPIYQGDGFKLYDVQNLRQLYPLTLPLAVIRGTAERLNRLYYTTRKRALGEAVRDIDQIVLEEIDVQLAQGNITVREADALRTQAS